MGRREPVREEGGLEWGGERGRKGVGGNREEGHERQPKEMAPREAGEQAGGVEGVRWKK